MGDEAEIKDKFWHHVNLSKAELKAWLDDEKSMNTGQDDGDGEPTGHKSGRQILEIMGRKGKETEDDIKHMRKVNGYCSRHLKQGNSKDPVNSKWRLSLLNWGCDPLKKPIGDSESFNHPGKGDSNGSAKAKESKAEDKEQEQEEKVEKPAASPKKGGKSPAKASASPKKGAKEAAEKPASPQKRKQAGQGEEKEEKKAKK